ncbi:MAG: nucleotide exchange factor GrpE [Clostridia bacterium]|nr:nucleotide exchange factor GrpE [Clostridia bacterium]
MAEEVKKAPAEAEKAVPETETEPAGTAEATPEKGKKNEIKALKETVKTLEADAKKAKEEFEAKLSEANDKFLRMMAEYDNYRKRSRAEKDNAYADACADVLKTLLPVFDNLKRAETFSDSDKLADGVRMTMSQYNEALKALGVEEFGSEGDAFDPNVHNAVMQQQRGDLEENTVVNVLQRGYRKGDRTIRCATVIVSTK